MATRSFRQYVDEEFGKFASFVVYALLEWTLIFLLFVGGFLAFFAHEFAKFFELRIPCSLCTRIDHVLVRKNHDFYYNESICDSHMKIVSCLAFCHSHRKLSDIRTMCENCLLSFATEKESDCDTYKSLVGILHKDLECFVDDDQIQLGLPTPKRVDAVPMDKTSSNKCSCCGMPLKGKSAYLRAKNFNTYGQAPAPSPRGHPFALRTDESRGLESPRTPRTPQMRFNEFKLMSENETEVREDDDASAANNQDNKLREDAKACSIPSYTETDEMNDESIKTPSCSKGNRFFGIPLTDSNSPRWAIRTQRKSPLERTEFASDSAEPNAQHEADGDTILQHLNRRLDRKSLIDLYMELDEERSASAVAANNAIAMITKLQAEKAAVQMEALQYQRMMEEEAEYDQEALRAAYEMIEKREEEIHIFEAELSTYREKYGPLPEFNYKPFRDETEKDNSEFQSQFNSSQSFKSDRPASPLSFRRENTEDNLQDNIDQISSPRRGEKTQLLGRMKKLERRVMTSNIGNLSFKSNADATADNETGKPSEDHLKKELSHLTERVKALEADGEFLDHVAKKLDSDYDGTKILKEISKNLENLRHILMTPSQEVAVLLLISMYKLYSTMVDRHYSILGYDV